MRAGGGCEGPASTLPLEVDESASEGQGRLFWACVQGRLLDVKRCEERGKCNCGHFCESVDFLKKCAGEHNQDSA